MGRPAIEMIGKTFGEWEVLERVPVPEGVNSHCAWFRCKCSCGVIRDICGSELRRRKTTSCGHKRFLQHTVKDIVGDYELLQLWPNEKGIGTWKCKCTHCGQETTVREARLSIKKDISCPCQERVKIGDTFGALTVLEILPHEPYKGQYYKVQCSCGNTLDVRRDHLLREETKSCGCGAATLPYRKDLHGQTFGYAQVLEYDAESSKLKGYTYWKCQCLLCGDTFSVLASNLTRIDRVYSCGKHNLSYGEERIKNFLDANQIPYIYQYRNQNMRFSKSNVIMPFDFAILNKDSEIVFLLEYDGEQHFQEISLWEGRDCLANRQARDKEKEIICQQKGVSLERISYKEKNNLDEILTFILMKYNITISPVRGLLL